MRWSRSSPSFEPYSASKRHPQSQFSRRLTLYDEVIANRLIVFQRPFIPLSLRSRDDHDPHIAPFSEVDRPVRQILIALLRLYKRFISPLLGQHCRFHPSCSEYAMQALDLHGVLKGSWLTIKRLARCQPFCEGGLDPVPPRQAKSCCAEHDDSDQQVP